jgi:hypothetical protein
MPKRELKIFNIPYFGINYRLAYADEDGNCPIGDTLCHASHRETLEAIKLALEFTAKTIKTTDALKDKALKDHYMVSTILFGEDS